LIVFGLLAGFARRAGGFSWDSTIVDLLSDAAPISDEDVHIDPFVTAITLGLSALMALLVLWLLTRRRFRAALFPVAAIGGALVLSSLAKVVVQRPAIEGGDGYSFPSGSATWSMATVAVAILLARPSRRRRLLALAGVVFLLGLGAVIAWEEWHYPSDVLAGWCLAFGSTVALWLRLRRPRVPPRQRNS
jgi:undecaprenyl-diphosphatase